ADGAEEQDEKDRTRQVENTGSNFLKVRWLQFGEHLGLSFCLVDPSRRGRAEDGSCQAEQSTGRQAEDTAEDQPARPAQLGGVDRTAAFTGEDHDAAKQ